MKFNFSGGASFVRFVRAVYPVIHVIPGDGTWKERFGKFCMVMKITTLLLLVACLQISAKGWSQQITLKERNAP